MVDAEPEHPRDGLGAEPRPGHEPGALCGKPELASLRAEAGDGDELRVQLAHRDEAEGIVGDRRVRPEGGQRRRELGGGEQVVWPEVGHARRHEPGGHDRLDLGRCPGTDGRRLRAGGGRRGEDGEGEEDGDTAHT